MLSLYFNLGHSAKYGAYSLMNLDQEKVIDFQLVQVRHFLLLFCHIGKIIILLFGRLIKMYYYFQSSEVKSSVHMELEGLTRGLELLKQKSVPVARIVTDRHVQVQKYLKTVTPPVKHEYDTWHVVKGEEIKFECDIHISKSTMCF